MRFKVGFLIMTMVISFMTFTGTVFADNSTIQIGEEYDITVTGQNLNVKITPNGVNVLSGAAATCSGATGANEDGSKLNDGDYTTKWSDAENELKWWQGDMGITNRISTFVLYNTGTKELNGNTGSFTLKVSSDGINWTDAWVSTKSSASAAAIMVYKLNTPVSARYVRFEINDSSSSTSSLYELEAWGEANTVSGIDPVNITTAAGYAPVLPAEVTKVWNDGTTTQAAVTWDSIDPAEYAEAGTFTVQGIVDGTSISASALVTVTNSAAVTLTGPEQVTEGTDFTLTCSLVGVQDIFAQDVTITYDSDMFDFVGAESAREGTLLEGTQNNAEKGTVRFILANTEQENVINGNADILHITFTPKVSGAGNIAVTNADLSNGQGGVSEAAGTSKAIEITPKEADKTELISAISTALRKYDSAEVGQEPGQYPADAKAALLSAINAATEILADVTATDSQVAQAVTDLNAAEIIFDAARIQDSDKTVLSDAINAALEIYNNAVEGLSIGNYPAGTRDRLNSAITAAAVVRDSIATTSQVAAAAADLNAALGKFQNLIITNRTGDLNNIVGIDIGDLGIIAGHYGIKAGDTGWVAIRQADINGDGEIGLYELAFIARKIVNG